MKCVNCKNCIGMIDDSYYLCRIGDELQLIEECIANNDEVGCELYDKDDNDDLTA